MILAKALEDTDWHWGGYVWYLNGVFTWSGGVNSIEMIEVSNLSF